MPRPRRQIAEFLKNSDNFLVTAHLSPDGDAMGATLAMGELLKALGKKYVLFNESPVPRYLEWIAGDRGVLHELPADEPQIIIVLDSGAQDRPGPMIAPWLQSKTVINIDHHLANPGFGTLNWVDEKASSVGEMIGALAHELGFPLAGMLGQFIYLSLISDTGDFSFNNTRPETLEMAAEILRQGLLPGPFHEQKQSTGTLNQLQMRGTVLQEASLHADGKISLISFTKELFEKTATGPEDTEGLVNTVLYLQGVQVAISLREDKDRIKFSLRSKGGTNVQAVAARFGGGGHRNAAGGSLQIPMAEAKIAMVTAVTEELLGEQA